MGWRFVDTLQEKQEAISGVRSRIESMVDVPALKISSAVGQSQKD